MTQIITRRKAIFGTVAGLGAAALPLAEANAEKTLEDVVSDIAHRFPCAQGLLYNRCQTGAFYVALVSGGLRAEGMPLPALYATPRMAIDAFAASFDKYAAGKSGILWWRTKPELMWFTGMGHPNAGWSVRSRLVIDEYRGLS